MINFRGLSLAEVMAELENSEDPDVPDIFITPPEVATFTDEDSADEDNGGLVDNLNGRQLAAPALAVHGKENDSDDDDDNDDRDAIPDVTRFTLNRAVCKTWIDGDIESRNDFPKSDFSKYKDMSPVEIFELMIDNAVIDLLVKESNKYALFLNCANPQITAEEMRCFLGILFVSGYNDLPSKKSYWDSGVDMRNIMVADAMRRDRFITIMRFLHCNDNNKLDNTDKMSKVRPLMNLLKNNFQAHHVVTEHNNFDESMIKYYGKHGCKQFIRGKPIRFGYKVWSLNTEDGYLANFQIYQGKSTKPNSTYESLFGKPAAVFVVMLDELPEKQLKYSFYFDNLFTSLNLLVHLKERGYEGTGTIRANRIPKSCPILRKKEMERKQRGIVDSTISKEDGLIVVAWKDNSVVYVASTCYGVQPRDWVKRYSAAEKKIITVSRPNLIRAYNQYMGGTDRMDEDIANYRIGIRGKKWYWSIFTWLLDSAMHNAWILFKKSTGELIPNLQFRRQVATTYLTKYGVPPKGAGRPAVALNSLTLNRISDDVRYDRRDHLVQPVPNKKRRRCAGEGCSSVGRTECSKCHVGLCVECFVTFHTK